MALLLLIGLLINRQAWLWFASQVGCDANLKDMAVQR
jgi:hypothetical protein